MDRTEVVILCCGLSYMYSCIKTCNANCLWKTSLRASPLWSLIVGDILCEASVQRQSSIRRENFVGVCCCGQWLWPHSRYVADSDLLVRTHSIVELRIFGLVVVSCIW